MPHPERYVQAIQHPQRHGEHGMGNGLLIFKNAFDYVQNLITQPETSVGAGVEWSGEGTLASPWCHSHDSLALVTTRATQASPPRSTPPPPLQKSQVVLSNSEHNQMRF